MDGTTSIPTTFTGPLEKLRGNDYWDLPKLEFNTINSPLDSFYLTLGSMEDLNADQRLLL